MERKPLLLEDDSFFFFLLHIHTSPPSDHKLLSITSSRYSYIIILVYYYLRHKGTPGKNFPDWSTAQSTTSWMIHGVILRPCFCADEVIRVSFYYNGLMSHLFPVTLHSSSTRSTVSIILVMPLKAFVGE